ncbi:hypothetical protein [uncultured Tateyamaria sp.]|uniref:hypothetical protein n=1 Tax=uncultured Tateyamaria sp. TaxID=455651 RepID=UPI00262E72DC|nr:hypothetical protein [uncultured Tateyamaria sp.]
MAVPLEASEEVLAGILWTTTALVIAISLTIGLFAGALVQRRLARIDGRSPALRLVIFQPALGIPGPVMISTISHVNWTALPES